MAKIAPPKAPEGQILPPHPEKAPDFDYSASHDGSRGPDNPPVGKRENPKVGKWYIYIIGAGLALFPIHNQFLTRLATTSSGDTIVFIPTIALLAVIMATGTFLVSKKHWEQVKANGWGDLRVAIPLAVIVIAVGLSGLTEPDLMGKLAPLFMGLVLFSLYLAARIIGKELFFPLAIGVAVTSLGVIAYQVIHPGTITGGYVFEANYDAVAGYVLLGAALFIHRWRWLLAALALAAMLLSGSPEALFSLAAAGAVMLLRRDLPGRKATIITGIAGVLLICLMTVLGLYGYLIKTINNVPASATQGTSAAELREPVGYRLEQIGTAMTHIKPLGNGYDITSFYTGIVHNVPLVIVQELGWPGVLAGAAWLWVSIYCLTRTKWKYAWVLVLSLSVWDHFIWTQLAPWWWAIAGASLASRETDLIFSSRKVAAKDFPDNLA